MTAKMSGRLYRRERNQINLPSLWEGIEGREPNYNHSTESEDSWVPAPCPLPKGGGLKLLPRLTFSM